MESASFDLTTYFPLIGGLGLLAIAALHIFRTKELGISSAIVLLVGGVLCASTAISKFSVNKDGVSIDMREVVKLSVEDLILFRSQTQEALANMSEQVRQLSQNQMNLPSNQPPRRPSDLQPLGSAPVTDMSASRLNFEKLESLQDENDKLIESISEVAPELRSVLDELQRSLNTDRHLAH